MFDELRKNFKIRSNGSPGIGPILLLGTLLFLSTACTLNESDRRIKLETLKLAPLSEMPDFVQSAAPEVQEAYRFAKANPDLLKQIPCYCGCNSLGHMNNYDCYVAALQADGQETEYENHAAY